MFYFGRIGFDPDVGGMPEGVATINAMHKYGTNSQREHDDFQM